jgi:DNA polymerase (family 10)
MINAQIAAALGQVADLLEFEGENPFRVRAYRNAARVVQDYPRSIASLVASGSPPLTDISGIGQDLAGKIAALCTTGRLPLLEELEARVPQSVLALMRIPGVGPKKAALLYKELKILTLDELRAACSEQRVRGLKGFGAKTEQSILAGITLAEKVGTRMYWAQADQFAQALLAHVKQCAAVRQIEAAGSYRRGRETIGDLDLVVDSADAAAVMNQFASFPGVAEVLGRGETKLSVRLESGLQVDLRVVPAESFGAALQYFTGSKDHNVALRSLAKERGLKINEYGVFRVKGEKETWLAGRTEADVYAALDLPCFPPELREARQEFEWASAGKLPQLVELGDIAGDLHMHTDATDGTASLVEMVDAARERGLAYIAITDHSKRVTMARGLNADRLRAQWAQIDELRQRHRDIRVLKGIEVDILEKGGLDLPDDVLREADWVVASVHYGQNQPRESITRRIVEALANPYVSAIAHPTGRLINHREPYQVDLEAVFAAAAQHRKLLELNANPKRLDLDDIACAEAKRHGIPIVISTDAHSTAGLDVMRYGVLQARRGGLERKDVANTRPWNELKKLIGHR